MSEVKFVHPYGGGGGDYHRALIETSNGIPIAEVGVTADEVIYYNYMNALELYLKAKFAENMLEMMGSTDAVRKLEGDLRATGRDGEIAPQ